MNAAGVDDLEEAVEADVPVQADRRAQVREEKS